VTGLFIAAGKNKQNIKDFFFKSKNEENPTSLRTAFLMLNVVELGYDLNQ